MTAPIASLRESERTALEYYLDYVDAQRARRWKNELRQARRTRSTVRATQVPDLIPLVSRVKKDRFYEYALVNGARQCL